MEWRFLLDKSTVFAEIIMSWNRTIQDIKGLGLLNTMVDSSRKEQGGKS